MQLSSFEKQMLQNTSKDGIEFMSKNVFFIPQTFIYNRRSFFLVKENVVLDFDWLEWGNNDSERYTIYTINQLCEHDFKHGKASISK